MSNKDKIKGKLGKKVGSAFVVSGVCLSSTFTGAQSVNADNVFDAFERLFSAVFSNIANINFFLYNFFFSESQDSQSTEEPDINYSSDKVINKELVRIQKEQLKEEKYNKDNEKDDVRTEYLSKKWEELYKKGSENEGKTLRLLSWSNEEKYSENKKNLWNSFKKLLRLKSQAFVFYDKDDYSEAFHMYSPSKMADISRVVDRIRKLKEPISSIIKSTRDELKQKYDKLEALGDITRKLYNIKNHYKYRCDVLTDRCNEEIINILNKDFNGKIEGLSAKCVTDVRETLLGCKLFKRLIEFARGKARAEELYENELSLKKAKKFKEALKKARRGETKWEDFLVKFKDNNFTEEYISSDFVQTVTRLCGNFEKLKNFVCKAYELCNEVDKSLSKVVDWEISEKRKLLEEKKGDRVVSILFKNWKENFENISSENIRSIFQHHKPLDGLSFSDDELRKTLDTSKEERDQIEEEVNVLNKELEVLGSVYNEVDECDKFVNRYLEKEKISRDFLLGEYPSSDSE